MLSVRIWSVESTYDAKAVKSLADKWAADSQLGNLSIQTVGISALPRHKIKETSLSDILTKATHRYLQQDDCVIFIADSGSSMPTHQRPQEPNSLIHHIEHVVQDNIFDGKVFLAQDVQELKAWLPVACKSLEEDSTAWQAAWDSVVAPFHDAFAHTPEDEVARYFEETLAEVRRERT